MDKLDCDECMKQLFYRGMIRHFRQEHSSRLGLPPPARFICDNCSTTFERLDGILQHLSSCPYNPKDVARCDICLSEFGRKFAADHMKSLHPSSLGSELEELLLKCETCDSTFKGKKCLKRHLPKCGVRFSGDSNDTDFTPQCDICHVRTALRDMGAHVMSQHFSNRRLDIREFRCDGCDKCYRSKLSLEAHFQYCSSGIQKVSRFFPCPKCGRSFRTIGNRASHFATSPCGGKAPMMCNDCDFTSMFQGSLMGHMKKHHSAKKKETFSCEICRKLWHSKSHFIAHVRLCSGPAPGIDVERFNCDACNFSKNTRHYLVRHINRSHPLQLNATLRCSDCLSDPMKPAKRSKSTTNFRKNACQICGQPWLSKELMREKLRKKTRKIFACRVCEFSASTAKERENHRKLHDSMEFNCDCCGLLYKSKRYLYEHWNRKRSLKQSEG